MKITREELKNLIAEEIRKGDSVLLEMPMMSTTGTKMNNIPRGSKMHAQDSGGQPGAEDPVDHTGEMTKRSLYHMSQQAQQLHDTLHGDENLEAWVQDKIAKASEYLESAFKAISYDKGPGQGRM